MTDHSKQPRSRGILATLRSNFLTGLVVILPIGVTIWLIWSVVGWIDGWVLPLVPRAYHPDTLIRQLLGEETRIGLRGVGVVVMLIFTVLVGWLAKGIIGRSLLRWGEHLVDRTPVVRSIYNGLKQIAETVFAQSEASFEKCCLVEYPRPGLWVIGFVSTKARGEIAERVPASGDVLAVFIPTTPNPTSGFLLYAAAEEVIMLDMKIEDAAKLIISAGLVYPGSREEVQAAVAAR